MPPGKGINTDQRDLKSQVGKVLKMIKRTYKGRQGSHMAGKEVKEVEDELYL